MMSLQKAHHVVRQGTGSYGEFVEASAVTYAAEMKRREPNKRYSFGDTVPHWRDQNRSAEGDYRESLASVNRSEMGSDPESRSGPRSRPASRSGCWTRMLHCS
jgi:hypothetical protein